MLSPVYAWRAIDSIRSKIYRCARRSGQPALHALRQPIHCENLVIHERLTLGNHLTPLVIQRRLLGVKRGQAARGDISLSGQYFASCNPNWA